MTGNKSVEKSARVAERRHKRNKAVRSTIKTYVTKAEKLISGKEADAAKEAVGAAISELDRATTKGVLHRNNAARRKSRLMKKLNQARSNTPS